MENMNSAIFPVLTTKRLTLRALSTDDQDAIFALRSDPEVNQYLTRQACTSSQDALHFINMVTDNIEKNNTLYWAITLTESKTLVGTICLFDFSMEKSSCEIGYELRPKYQGQGIMNEAVRVVIDYVFETLKFESIRAQTDYRNQNSIHVLSKFNFIKSEETDIDNPDLTTFVVTKQDFIGSK